MTIQKYEICPLSITEVNTILTIGQASGFKNILAFPDPKIQNPSVSPILKVYFAPNAPIALILRVFQHRTEMILWETNTDKFTYVQWLIN